MKTTKKLKLGGLLLAIVAVFMLNTNANASNIQIPNEPTIEVAGLGEGGAGYMIVRFDLTWEFSWRSAQLRNWDAAWVFVKYRIGMDHWDHMFLDPTFNPNTGMNNNGVPMAFEYGMTPGADLGAVGVFLFREQNGQGNNNWQNIGLRWRFDRENTYIGRPQLFPDDEVIVRVFAIEMVFIPEGPFFLGDGSNTPGVFTRADEVFEQTATGLNIIRPFRVTSEAQPIGIAMRPTDSTGLDDVAGMLSAVGAQADVMSNTGFGIGTADNMAITPQFPKGFQAFWIMKYEITQSAYMDFLNTLEPAQQINRIRSAGTAALGERVMISPNVTVAAERTADRTQIVVVVPGVIEFGLATEFGGVAQSMGRGDVLAFLDWAGLRPMTELEFEKASRGPLSPIPGEFPWGATFASGASVLADIANRNLPNEQVVNPTTANHNNSAATRVISIGMVTRNGAFATATSDRIKAGATFWGVMEMGSNLAEPVINISTSWGRMFDGRHGDGRLNIDGDANVVNWPVPSELFEGLGHRGGNVNNFPVIPGGGLQTLSQRDVAQNSWDHEFWTGGRGVRTAAAAMTGPSGTPSPDPDPGSGS